ncbi:MAG: gliding motility-associated C-terminal domain-containing protein, partial [Bacteroidales bacterium]
DSDGDGVTDGDEKGDTTDPLDQCSLEIASQTLMPSSEWTAADCDSDGLSNATELSDGTNPVHPDSDGDGVTDNNILLFSMTSDDVKSLPDGSFIINYELTLTNLTSHEIRNLQVFVDLIKAFPRPAEFQIVKINFTENIGYNTLFNGSTATEILLPGYSLKGKSSIKLTITIKFDPVNISGPIVNSATATGSTLRQEIEINSIDIENSGGRITGEGLPTIDNLPAQNIEIFDFVTPNSDGYNDTWIISRPYDSHVEVRIFNRWGQLVYEDFNYQNDWDGRGVKNRLGEYVTPGTYFYIVKIFDKQAEIVVERNGFLTIRY